MYDERPVPEGSRSFVRLDREGRRREDTIKCYMVSRINPVTQVRGNQKRPLREEVGTRCRVRAASRRWPSPYMYAARMQSQGSD